MTKFVNILLGILLFGCTEVYAQKITVRGTVTDKAGLPVISAAVIDKTNTKNATVTDTDGKYKIVVNKTSVLEYSALSYKTTLESVSGREIIDVVLEEDTILLDQAVAIGYGTSKKGDLTGSVAVVEMENIQDTPATSVASTLQGRIAGVDIVSGSGEPGQTTSIQIRGARSLNAGNEPLIVVDGVLDAVGSLDDINPSDIVSISVLKDVSSTAIYGSRGANGVILVTTSQKADSHANYKVVFKSSTGFSRIAGALDIMNATEFASWQNQVASSRTSFNGNYPFPDPTALGTGTNWINELSQRGVYDSQFIQISGGTDRTRISVSGGFNYNKGVIIGQDFRRYTVRSSVDSKLSKTVRLGLQFNMVATDANRPNSSISGISMDAAIYLSPILDTESIWNKYSYQETQGVLFNNPYKCAKSIDNKAEKWNFNIVPWILLNPVKNLTIKSTFSFNKNDDKAYYYSPSSLPVAAARKTGGTAYRGVLEKKKFQSETTMNYKVRIKDAHSIEALVGFTAGYEVQDISRVSGSGYIDDDMTYKRMGGTMSSENLSVSSTSYEKSTMSVLGRINYNYKRRYYLTMTARADGASNFSESNKWGFFPAVAFRWSIMNEPWMSKSWWLNDLSLRASAGRSGNDAISSYLSMATIALSKGSWYFADKYLLTSVPEHLANSGLTWETTDSYNLGLNFSAWNSRVTAELEGYLSYTKNLLLSRRIAQTTGYSSYFDNMGSTRNFGVEFTLNTINVKKMKFEWKSSFTISHNNQLVLDSGAEDEVVPTYMNPRNSTQYMYGYKTGYPVNALWGYKKEGVWHNQAELDRNQYTHKYVSTITDGSNGSNLGRTKYIDVNGDGILDQSDMFYLGNSDPVVYGGFQNNFKFWGRLNVNLYFTYSIGGKIYNISELWLGSSCVSWNKYRYVSNAWNADTNPESDIARPEWDDINASDFHIHDASFFRLKSLTVSYDFPINKWSRFFKGLNVGLTGENLFLVKNYNGFDPDVSTDATIRRLDVGSFPRPRTVTLNVKLNF